MAGGISIIPRYALRSLSTGSSLFFVPRLDESMSVVVSLLFYFPCFMSYAGTFTI